MKFLNLLIVLFLFYNFGGSSSSSCGELGNITYPYHLPGICKWKIYELQCDGNDTVLYMGATKYLVKNMSIENMTLRLVDPDLPVGGCRLPDQQILSKHYNLFEWYWGIQIIYFFNCTEEVEDSMYKPIHCMDGPRSRIYAVYSNDSYLSLSITPKSCRCVASSVADSEVVTHWNDTDDKDMMQMLSRGIVTGWGSDESCSPLQYCWSITKSSSSCGELGNITYPYHLPGNCKWKPFELQCDGNDTVLYMGATKYLVKDMSIENMTLRLVDPDLPVGGCRLPDQQILSKHYNLFDWYSGIKIIYFFNCTAEVEDSMYKPIHCMDGPRSRIYAVYSNDSYLSLSITPKSCRCVASSVADSEVVTHWNDTDGKDMMQMLSRGIVTGWGSDESCSPLQYCWSYTKSYYDDYTTGDKLLELFSIQTQFLTCIYNLQRNEPYMNSRVVFGSMLILLLLLDILLVLLVIRLTLLPLVIFSYLLHKYKQVSLSINSVEKFLRKHEMLAVRRYDFIEIAIMTNHFRERIGQGGFGSVYKGKLFSGCQVAVKILTNSFGNGDDFISEVATIGRIHHANIVHLIGFCSDGSKRALVYPYMSKGSLDKYIFSSHNNSISVEKRREIALGIARGIDYLHRGCQMQILHFDIKPHNILLDHDLTPKISDFGLAKLYSREYNLVTLNTARGTIGYIAPELISRAFGAISYKADVYSFGMLLMELASGRRNVNNNAESSSQVYYPSLIYDQMKLADETLNYNLHNSVVQFGERERILYKVALWCIQTRASNRPSMSRVIEMLQCEADSLEMPPRPFMTG